ncbi:MAG: phospho-N-acetylmuramoyl-pentapeptide-transferase [Clostridiales bacterium]|jgi:phospho-N-acetylmuramoyl-pentapeptide-transferase|nr:phospho-N-acetylmuramoyl-pentapeptide-transferase [Clostridiales bacterium]
MFYPVFFIGIFAVTFLLTAGISHFLIPILASHKMGQKILEIGPRWHKSKEGTPTMGGLAFIIAALITGIFACIIIFLREGAKELPALVLTLAMAMASGLIGMIDDMAKLRKKQNEGLTAPQKFLLQLICAGVYLFGMSRFGQITTELYIPYLDIAIDFGLAYYIIALLLLCGVMNSVNLTDGIDGLASSMTVVVGLFYGAAALFHTVMPAPGLTAVAAIMAGAAAGFLIYNFYPARVFMGDTGSLFFGGLVVGAAFMMDNPLIVVVCGLVYIFETASTMLQVMYFKLTSGKRLFKMAPFHHHLEKCGWSEIKIVAVFSLLTACLCVCAWFGL